MTNIVLVGALLKTLPILTLEAVEKSLEDHLPERHKKLLPLNMKALRAGTEFVERELARETT
jgi:2-oxoglutarate ferredoxin oxidoreductase subunit gamma